MAPVLTAVSSTEIQISWNVPQFPNGAILSYGIYRVVGNGETLEATFNGVGSYVVGGLEPFTEYAFLMEACTSIGCNRSEAASALTLESGE